MNLAPRLPSIAALAACVSLILAASACDRDEPATYVPKSGEWTFETPTVVGNSCSADFIPEPLLGVLIDYDGGDSFQIELGENDVNCEIDGTDFYCTDFTLTFEVEGFDATVRADRTWEGEFGSDSQADVTEIYTVTCSGESCEVVAGVPCTYTTTFEANAV